MILVRLPKNIEKRLADLARETKKSKEFYIKKALEFYLEDVEDTYLALSVLEKPGKRWTHEEIEKELDVF